MNTSLAQLKSQEYEIMQGMVDCIWDEESGENLTLSSLQEQIQAKTEAFISVTKKDGLFDQEIATVKKAIETAKTFIERIDKKREYIKSVIFDLAIKAPEGFLTFSDGVSKQYVKPQMGQRRSIKQDAVIEAEYKSYTLPKFDDKEMTLLGKAINHYRDSVKDDEHETFHNVFMKHGVESNESCNVTDLPENHSAIQTKLIPGFKIVKNKPKL
ncbi:MAG: hypothetical protein P4L35_11205 [Ignavibacteriaceae bacterium]|nr:hypothetical protein [Ignavibacteriaceae bacterium]